MSQEQQQAPVVQRRATARADGSSVITLQRGLMILDAFLAARGELGVNEIARQVKVHKSTVSRLCATLEQAGYLDRNEQSGKFRLGPRIYQLAGIPLATLDLQRAARPVLLELVEACGETAHLAILDGHEAVTIAVVDGRHSVRMEARIGRRAPLNASALGKALLAGLPREETERLLAGRPLPRWTARTITDHAALMAHIDQVREQGYSVDLEELEEGLRCVGAPVYGPEGRAVAAISISGPRDRFTSEAIPRLGRLVRECAERISLRLGAVNAPAGASPDGAARPRARSH